jgi:predicted dehydrogenase
MAERGQSLRIGVVGLGGMGRRHAENTRKLGQEVAAGADVVADARESFAAEFDANVYGSHEAMYGAEALDVVVVTTPNKFHESAAVDALEAGCSILVEKPLAHTLDAAERIAEAARRADGHAMVGFHSRFSAATKMFKGYQEDGRFGEITHVQANYVRRRGVPGGGSWFTDRSLSGGGALIDIGVHAIDYALYLLGFPEVEEVKAVTRSNFGHRNGYVDPDDWFSNWDTTSDRFDVEDAVSGFISCAGGQTISLEVAWASSQEPTKEFVVRGTEAGAKFPIGGDELTLYETADRGVDHYVDAQMRTTPVEDERRDELAHLLDAVRRDVEPSMNTVDQALAVQRVVDVVYESAETGRATSVGGVDAGEETPRRVSD